LVKINNVFKKLSTNSNLNGYEVDNLPMPQNIDLKTKEKIISTVNQILAITKDADYLDNPAKQTQVKEYEEQIDQMVYDLYA